MSETFPILIGYRASEQMAAIRRSGQSVMVVGLPWAMIAPHEAQAQRNHSQTLRRLSERGGLGWGEAVAVLSGRDWSRTLDRDEVENNRRLTELLRAWLAANPEPTP